MRLIVLVLILLAGLCSPQLWAATCSAVFPGSITGSSANQLDLSGVAWQNAPALGASNRSLGVGDHYFGGGGTFNDWALAATGGASTRVFVNGSLTLANNSQLNAGGNPQDLILIVNGSLSLGNNVEINGFVYVTGSIGFGNNLQLDGAITSVGAAGSPGGGGTSLNYNGAAIDLADFGSLCSPTIQLRLSWSLDESTWTGAAGEVLDSSGNGFNGTVFNGANTANSAPALPTQNSLGTCGYGSFNSAANQYVQRAHNNLLTLQDSFTIGLWVKPNTLPASGLMSILSKDENYEFHLRPDGTVNWWWQTSGPAATRELNSTTALTPGQWSHVLIRFAPGDQRIYINGNLAGQAGFGGTPLANSDPLQLGADQNLAGRYFNGQLDELRIYSGALSESAIDDLVAERHQCELALQCFNDDFGRASLGSDWAVASRGATTFTPAIASARMRLTSNQGNVATSSTLQRLFPAAGNYIQVQFRHYAYNGSGADGIAVVLSDASITPQPGAFGGPLGYGTRGDAANPGFAGGWLGVGIDEYGNFSTEGGSPNDGPGQRPDSVAMRGSGSDSTGYRYIAGTPANLNPGIDNAASTAAAPGHIYRITMDGRFNDQALVTVERDSGAGFEVLPSLNEVDVLAAVGQAELPANFYLSLTGSTGGSTNIHELDDLQVCATTINPVTAQIDHFDFAYADTGLTCSPQQVIVRACMNADCSTLYTDPVTVTLAPSGSWSASAPASVVNGNVLSFSGGSAVAQLRRSIVGQVAVGAQASTPTVKPNSQTTCSTAGCLIGFVDSGFIFDVPNLLANKESADVGLFAVRKDDTSEACVPAFESGTRTLQFWSAYSDPNSGTRTVQVNGTPIAGSAPGSNIDLSFGAGAQAVIRVHYADAGLMTLNARYAPTSGEEAGLVMNGADQFVSKPYGFLLQTDTLNACTSADITCPVFPGVRAGDPFDLRISAVAWQSDGEALVAAALADNLITPNFQTGDIGLTSLLVGPSGGVDGTVAPGDYDHLLGEVTTVTTAVSEVGVFNLIAAPTTNYFGEVVSGGTSGLVGRFIPAYLGATGSASLTPSCGSAFSYQGQPMEFAVSHRPLLTVSGHNRQGAVTQNYDRGAFWRLSAPAVGSYSSTTGTSVDTRLVTQGTASLSTVGADDGDGSRGYRWSGEQLLYTPAALPGADDVPFMARISQSFSAASLTDADGACYGAGAACGDFIYPFTDDPGSEVRLGRLRIGNAHGSELQALNLPLTIESWQATAMGNSFAPEGLDNCTAAVLGAPVLDGFTGSLAAGETTPSLSGPLAGSGLVGLTAPGAGNEGSVRVSFLPALPPTWLYYDWNGNGREMASGLATFGIYRGAPPLIFRRELYR